MRSLEPLKHANTKRVGLPSFGMSPASQMQLEMSAMHQRVEKVNCTMLNSGPVREFARLQETVGKEAHIVAPPTWHAGRVEIGYHERLIGG